jgi:hypothetical protein
MATVQALDVCGGRANQLRSSVPLMYIKNMKHLTRSEDDKVTAERSQYLASGFMEMTVEPFKQGMLNMVSLIY